VSTNDRSKQMRTLLEKLREPRLARETHLRRKRRFAIERHHLAERRGYSSGL
jgi:hypothetical protein